MTIANIGLVNARDSCKADIVCLAEQLLLIIEGAIVFAHVMGEKNIAHKAKQAAINLLGHTKVEQKIVANI